MYVLASEKLMREMFKRSRTASLCYYTLTTIILQLLFESYIGSNSFPLPSFSKLRLFSASWSAFLWYSVNLCCSMILSFSSRDMLASELFLRFACDREQQSCYDADRNKEILVLYPDIKSNIYLFLFSKCILPLHPVLSSSSQSWCLMSCWQNCRIIQCFT